MKVSYEAEVINAILKYLQTKPYVEVVNIIAALQNPEIGELPEDTPVEESSDKETEEANKDQS